MLLKPLLLAAAAVNAVLVVPQASKQDESIFKALPVKPNTFQLAPELLAQSISIPCRQCHGKDTKLQLDFAVEDGTRLLVNGFELFPHADPWNGDLVAPMVRASGKEIDRRLGYSLSVVPREVDHEQELELLDVRLRVIEVGNHFVQGIPIVKVGLIKATTGELVIANTDLEEPAPDAGCRTLFCLTKSMLGDAMRGFRGCRKHKQHQPNAHHGHGHGPADAKHASEPKKHHDAYHHRHQWWSSHHDWTLLAKNIASHIVLPVLLGITSGIGVAFFGLALCGIVLRLSAYARGERQPRSWCLRPRWNSASLPPTADEEKASLLAVEEARDEPATPYKDEDDVSEK